MNETLRFLYDRFYTPLPMVESEQEVENCHRQLIERLEFELAWQLSMELNQFEKERSVSRCTAKRSGALSMSGKEEAT